MNGKVIFVTGASGFIGSRVVKQLIGQGYTVRCLLRITSRTDRIDGLDCERSIGDILDIATLEAGMTGCHGVIHLAGLSGWRDLRFGKIKEVIVEGTKNVLLAARRCGNLRTVYVSSAAAIDGTDTPQILNEASPFTLGDEPRYAYALAKQEAEKLCRRANAEGLPVITVNPSEVYGPGDQDLITAGNLAHFAGGSPVLVCRGGTGIVHVDDAAAGIIRALEKGRAGERYILSGENLTIRELAALTAELLGQKKTIITLPNTLVGIIAGLGERLGCTLNFEPAAIPYAVKYWFMDNLKAKRELDVNFRSAKDTLRPTLEWLKEIGIIS